MGILKNKTLLYAEDEIEIQAQYEIFFKNYFYKVIVANDGQEALDLYNKHNPDVLILDINMPKIDGLTLVKNLRENKCEKDIVLLTARSDREALKKAITLHLTEYLEKPISRSELKNTLLKIENNMQDSSKKCLWQEEGVFFFWDEEKKELVSGDKVLTFTKNETILFELFISRFKLNTSITYQDIYETVWYDKDKEYSETTIKTLLNRLRSKLPKNAIKNTYGLGYSINLNN